MPHSCSEQAPTLRLKKLEIELAELKQIQQNLKQRLEDYRLIVENINDVAYQLDLQGRFTYVSPVIEYKTGFTPKELIGRKFHEFVYPDDLPWLKERFLLMVSERDSPPQMTDFRARIKSGDYLWVRDSSRRLRQNGKVSGLIGIWRDIQALKQAEAALKTAHAELEEKVKRRTQKLSRLNKRLETEIRIRKNAETALRDSEAHLRSLMEAASNFAVYRLVFDEKRPMMFRVVFVSPSINELMGITATDDFEKWNEVIHPDDLKRVTEANLKSFKTRTFNETFRIYHAGKKEWRWIHAVSTGIFDADRRVNYVNGIFIDVTDQKLAEERLLSRELELETKTLNLEEMNTTLRVLLQKRNEDRSDIEEKVINNVRELILPYIVRLSRSDLEPEQASLLDIIQSNLADIVSPFSQSLSSKFLCLTPTEIQIANFIRQGKTTKEIGATLNLSSKTIDSHRKSIRKKLGLRCRKANLRAHLISI